jgi:hypothetical protein
MNGKFSTLRASMTKDSLGFLDESKPLSWLACIAHKSRKKEFTLFCVDLSPIFFGAAS